MSGFLGSLWQSLPQPAFVIDSADVIVEANPAAEGFFNTSARGLRGQQSLEFLAIDAPLEDAFERVRSREGSFAMSDADVGTGAAPPVLCNLHIAPLAGMPGFLLLMFEPRQLADRLERAHSVKTAAKSAIGMAEMLAHEIKNPLAGITGAAQLLSMNLAGDDRELTDLIVAETRRILALLDQVEQFGNLRPPERRAVNIHDLLDRARKSAEVGFAAHVKFIEEYDPSLPPTDVDGDQMLQVFLNLFKNAAEAAAKEGGEIRIRTFYDLALRLRRTDGTRGLPLQVEIIDDGPGLPPDLAQEIFEPFVSGRENGTGLGLALVSKILSDHGGMISVDSVPGRTVFRISLPLAGRSQDDDGDD
ncbi:MAG: ATP-binding protein [Pseudomonadota bacterium]